MKRRTRSSAREPPWCKDCDAEFAGACVDAGHRPYSAKMLREDESARPIELLELGVAASNRLVHHTQRFVEAGAREAERNTASKTLLSHHLQRLREATASGTGFDKAIQLSREVVDQVPELQRRAALLASVGRLRVTLERTTGASLEANLRLVEGDDGDDLSLARLLLLQLLDAGALQEITTEVPTSSSGETQSPLFELDLSSVARKEIQKLLGDAVRCRQIRKLTCGSADFVGSLLKLADLSALLAKVEHLEELQLPRPPLAALHQMSMLTALRRLDLTLERWSPDSEERMLPGVQYPALPPGLIELRLSTDNSDSLRILEGAPPSLRALDTQCLRWDWWRQEDGSVFSGLPASVERLRIEDCSTDYLMRAACRLPRLRELALLCTKYVHDFTAPPLTPGHVGVHRLEVRAWCKDTLQNLVAAHAATVTHLGVHTGTKPSCCFFPFHGDLSARLDSMELPALRRLVLHRHRTDRHSQPHPDSPDEEEVERDACRRQLHALRVAVRPGVEIVCSVCHSERVHAPFQ